MFHSTTVEDEPERPQLVLHALVVALVQGVAALLEVADALDVALVGLVVDIGQDTEVLNPPMYGRCMQNRHYRPTRSVTNEHPTMYNCWSNAIRRYEE